MSADLDTEVKLFIIQSLACFDPPSKVVKAVKETFGITVSRQAVHHYDPERKGGEALPEQWRETFAATRKRFLEKTADIGISNCAVRLQKLNRVADQAEERGNHVVVIAACEAAAKEMGGAFPNRRELTGKDGKDLPRATGAVIILPDNGRDCPSDLSKSAAQDLVRSEPSDHNPAS